MFSKQIKLKSITSAVSRQDESYHGGYSIRVYGYFSHNMTNPVLKRMLVYGFLFSVTILQNYWTRSQGLKKTRFKLSWDISRSLVGLDKPHLLFNKFLYFLVLYCDKHDFLNLNNWKACFYLTWPILKPCVLDSNCFF